MNAVDDRYIFAAPSRRETTPPALRHAAAAIIALSSCLDEFDDAAIVVSVGTGEGRVVPTLDELIAQRGSRLEATVERARYFELIRPPAIGEAPPVEGMPTLRPMPDVVER